MNEGVSSDLLGMLRREAAESFRSVHVDWYLVPSKRPPVEVAMTLGS